MRSKWGSAPLSIETTGSSIIARKESPRALAFSTAVISAIHSAIKSLWSFHQRLSRFSSSQLTAGSKYHHLILFNHKVASERFSGRGGNAARLKKLLRFDSAAGR